MKLPSCNAPKASRQAPTAGDMQLSGAMLRIAVKDAAKAASYVVSHGYHFKAELLHEFRRHGSQFPACIRNATGGLSPAFCIPARAIPK